MNEKKITRIIAKKTSLYFKFSMILFVVSLILLSTAFLFVLQQYIQLNNDFVDNANTHIIKIIQKRNREQTIHIRCVFQMKQKFRILFGIFRIVIHIMNILLVLG